jgi:hypothetical protein
MDKKNGQKARQIILMVVQKIRDVSSGIKMEHQLHIMELFIGN